MPGWIQLERDQPCPICGAGGFCEAGHRAVWCSSVHSAATAGWHEAMPDFEGHAALVRPGQGPLWRTFVEAPLGDDALLDRAIWPDFSDLQRRTAAMAARAHSELTEAAKIARSSKRDHPLALKHFAALGVPIADLPGHKLPASVLVLERDVPLLGAGPAVVLCFTGPDGKIAGLEARLCNEDGSAREVKRIGPFAGGLLRLGDTFAQRMLLISETPEDGISIAAATGWTVWAAPDARWLPRFELSPTVNERAGYLILASGATDAPWAMRELLKHWSQKLVDVKIGWASSTDGRPPSQSWRELAEKAGASEVRDLLQSSEKIEGPADKKPANKPPEDEAPKVPDDLILPENNLERARMALEFLYSPEDRVPERGWRLRRWDGEWWRHDGARWVPLKEEVLKADVKKWLHRFWHWRSGPKGSRKLVPLNPSEKTVLQVLADIHAFTIVQAERMPVWLPQEFDSEGELAGQRRPWESCLDGDEALAHGLADPRLVVPCRNGLLDIAAWNERRAVFRPHSELFFMASRLPYDCPVDLLEAVVGDDEKLDAAIAELCPLWLEFLGAALEGDEECEQALAMLMGLSLTPDMSWQTIAVLPGPPGSGKSTCIDAWIATVGRDNVAISDMNQITRPFHLHALVGKNLCAMTDADTGRMTDGGVAAETLKKISAGDPVFVDRKNRDALPQCELFCKIVIACNRMPSIPDSGGALARRFRIIPFEESFVGKERREFKDPAVLLREAPGRLLWALRGLRQLHGRQAIPQPRRGCEILEEWSAYADPFGAFIAECLELDQEKAFEYSADIFKAWAMWRARTGGKANTDGWMGKELRAHCPKLKRVQRGEGRKWGYEGVRIDRASLPGFDAASHPLLGADDAPPFPPQ